MADDNNSLRYYSVLGMRWGHRKIRTKEVMNSSKDYANAVKILLESLISLENQYR